MKKFVFLLMIFSVVPVFGLGDAAKAYIEKLRSETKSVNWEKNATDTIVAAVPVLETPKKSEKQNFPSFPANTTPILIEPGIRVDGNMTYDPKESFSVSLSDFENEENLKDYILFVNAGWFEEASRKAKKDSFAASKIMNFYEKNIKLGKKGVEYSKNTTESRSHSNNHSVSHSSGNSYSSGKTWVKSYSKKDGTRVTGHYRRK